MLNENRPTDRLRLRAGEWVEIRSKSEILATLDEQGRVDGLPFMPEMLAFCGQRVRVYKVAHKTCDTIKTYTNRHMPDAVHLEGLRCDGAVTEVARRAACCFGKRRGSGACRAAMRKRRFRSRMRLAPIRVPSPIWNVIPDRSTRSAMQGQSFIPVKRSHCATPQRLCTGMIHATTSQTCALGMFDFGCL